MNMLYKVWGGYVFFWILFVLFLVSLGLCCCIRAFSSYDEQGLLSSCGLRASHCGGFSCCRAQASDVRARASLVEPHNMYNLPGPGIEPQFPALAGRFLTTGPSGKSLHMYFYFSTCLQVGGFPDGSVGKESACNARDSSSIPGSGRSLEGGHGSPLQCSCLENFMDRGAWWATVHGVTKSQTWLKQLNRHAYKWKDFVLFCPG